MFAQRQEGRQTESTETGSETGGRVSALVRFERLSSREQRLITILAVVFGGLVLIGTPGYVFDMVARARDANTDISAQLQRMERATELLAKRRGEREARELLYGTPAPALAAFIEGAARAHGIDVPESADQPDVVAKTFTERSTQVKFRKVGLKPLVNALEQLEHSKGAVSITRLKITSRNVPDEYDVVLTVSAYDKKEPARSGKAEADGKGDDGGSGDAERRGDAEGKPASDTKRGAGAKGGTEGKGDARAEAPKKPAGKSAEPNKTSEQPL
ncbi:MAG: hypothetical protein EXR75_02875 [Myxococcales bacterium]|nr:hypothetical protein [Myxococcales bacterium]